MVGKDRYTHSFVMDTCFKTEGLRNGIGRKLKIQVSLWQMKRRHRFIRRYEPSAPFEKVIEKQISKNGG